MIIMMNVSENNKEQWKEEASKVNKKKKKWWLIPVGIFVLLAVAVMSIPKLLFTDYAGLPTTGEYGVKMVSAILVDDNRVEKIELNDAKALINKWQDILKEVKKESVKLFAFLQEGKRDRCRSSHRRTCRERGKDSFRAQRQ